MIPSVSAGRLIFKVSRNPASSSLFSAGIASWAFEGTVSWIPRALSVFSFYFSLKRKKLGLLLLFSTYFSLPDDTFIKIKANREKRVLGNTQGEKIPKLNFPNLLEIESAEVVLRAYTLTIKPFSVEKAQTTSELLHLIGYSMKAALSRKQKHCFEKADSLSHIVLLYLCFALTNIYLTFDKAFICSTISGLNTVFYPL